MLRFVVFVLPLVINIAAADEWVELGCFADRVWNRALPTFSGYTGVTFPSDPKSSNLRPIFESCRKIAETKGFTFFGIQNKAECWGGMEHAQYNKHEKEVAICHTGKDGFMVGEPDANAVYQIKVDGGYSKWSKWGDCGKTCGEALKTRKRTCTNPKPRGAGETCKGPDTQRKACNLPVCPVPGGWSDYGKPSPCSKSCGGGEQVRARCCINPKPSPGGKKCSGRNAKVEPCNTQPCPAK